jgi:plasmid stabilization system protein ParE
MSYTVIWKETAEEMLAEIWMAASDRQSVTNAANTIDSLLKRDPQQQGESRGNSFRVMFVAPLAVHYEVQELDQIVQVLRVWQPPLLR